MKRLLVLATIAVFMVVGVAGLASANYNVGSASQKGSLLIFPKIDTRTNFDTSGGQELEFDRDTYIAIGNDGGSTVTIECIWNYPKLTSIAPYSQECCGSQDFTMTLSPYQVVYFSAGTGLANLFGKTILDTVNPIPRQSSGIGSLFCFAVNNQNAKQPIAYNNLYGDATVVRYELTSGLHVDNGLSSWGYQAYAFIAHADNKAPMATLDKDSNSYLLNLTGKQGAYDACPNLLTFNFIAKQTIDEEGPLNAAAPAKIGSDLTLVPCTQDLRESAISTNPDVPPVPVKNTITMAKFDIINANEDGYSGAYACVKCFFEQILGDTSVGNEVWVPEYVDENGQTVEGHWETVSDITDAFQIVGGDNFVFMPLHGGVGTLMGRARVDGVASAECGATSINTPLLGVIYDFIDVVGLGQEHGLSDRTPEAASGRNITGVGAQKATIRYNK